MNRLARVLLLVAGCFIFLAQAPKASAQVVVIGHRHHHPYYHHHHHHYHHHY